MEYLADLTRHHNVEFTPIKLIVSGTTEKRAMAAALVVFLQYVCGYDESDDAAFTYEGVLAKLGEAFNLPDGIPLGFGDLVLWSIIEDGRWNVGFGESSNGKLSGTCKSENWWVHTEPWVLCQDRIDELEKLTKEELINMLIRLEAVA